MDTIYDELVHDANEEKEEESRPRTDRILPCHYKRAPPGYFQLCQEIWGQDAAAFLSLYEDLLSPDVFPVFSTLCSNIFDGKTAPPALDSGLSQVAQDTLDTNSVEAFTRAMRQSIASATPSRRFFRTEKGYIGLGPPNTRVGDEVFILDGGTVPFLLRSERESLRFFVGELHNPYTLVGDCYVYGIMDGECEVYDRHHVSIL
jgi:hypothetical protein